MISRPLTELLRKDNFHWNPKVEAAFRALKKAMTQAPVLALPNFSKPFYWRLMLVTAKWGAVLMQEGRPLAYISQGLAPKHCRLSVYDKESITVLVAVDRWLHYLESNPFVIKIDYESLQFLLQQRFHTHLQRKGVSKLLGLDYTIQYRKGKENVVANALSRREGRGT